jgi:hypothetical protein
MEQMRKMSVDNAVFLPMVVESIERGHTATIIARGNSMRPFIEDGRDKLVFGKADKVSVGDVVLAEIEDGHFVCHRVERIEHGIVTMRGDGNVPCKANGTGTETFPIERVRAKLVQVIKPGKTYTLATSRTWKIYSAIWPRLLPLRRYLLALYRLLWFHQLPARWTKKD